MNSQRDESAATIPAVPDLSPAVRDSSQASHRPKGRGRGFNLRAAAAIVDPSLLNKLPPVRGRDEPTLFSEVAANPDPGSQQKRRSDDVQD